MKFVEFRKLLQKLHKVHPEMDEADVWALDMDDNRFLISYVGYDKKHKPARVKLEE